MQRQTTKTTLIAMLALSLGACASHPAPAPDLSTVQNRDYVATRAFQMKSSPSINATTLTAFREGDALRGRAAPAAPEPWTYLILQNGPEGYVFGWPFIAEREGR